MTIDPAGIQALADSLTQMGMIQPILVERRGKRYRIHAGHRRFLAARAAGFQTVPSIVYGPGAVNGEAIKLHENVYREDLNPAEEAVWLATLLERDCGGDVDRLVELVKQKRDYLETRLLLLQGDEEIIGAVQRSDISLAVARELNKYTDQGLRRMRLGAALAGGASARIVREWRNKDEALAPILLAADAAMPAATPPAVQTIDDFMKCFVCESSEDKHEMVLKYVHRLCERVVLRRLLAEMSARAQAAQERERPM